jgi:hypothetical protein
MEGLAQIQLETSPIKNKKKRATDNGKMFYLIKMHGLRKTKKRNKTCPQK